jgi:glycosyltransferase involved in cell wall biosynthesis
MLGSLFRSRNAVRHAAPLAGQVSVVVPLYNHAEYIAGAIESALAQGAVLRELVVIDDGSTDGSDEAMRRLARRDARIRFRRQANRGAAATLNAAIAACSGAYVAILNSDDAWLPGRLEALVAALHSAPGAALAASGIAFMDGSGSAIANDWHAQALSFRAGTSMATALVNGNFLVSTSNFLFRRELPEAIGGFAALRYAHDLDFALRALALGHGIALLDQPLLRYRVHARNTIAEDHRRVRAEWAAAAAAYLTLRWDRADAPEPDWAEAAAIEAVLQRHELSRAVHLCMAWLRRHAPDRAAPGRLDRAPFLADPHFRALLAGWV